jgi:tRNA(adenine34) deaminase
LTLSDTDYMAAALAEAHKARDLGEVPVGCVIVGPDGNVLGRGHNRTRTDKSPLAHAEMLAIAEATRALDFERLTGCTVFVTLEPCFMCAGALGHARVNRVVFPVRDPKFGGCVSLGHVLSDARLNHRARLEPNGPLADECRAILVGFFRERRGKPAEGEQS